jgi:outer membrane immunogenic protein
MQHCLRTGVGCLVAAFTAVSAYAADPAARAAPPVLAAPVFTWTGFYLGANVGYAWSPSTGDLDGFTPGSAANAVQFGNNVPRTFDLQREGVVGGVQLGFNFQNGAFVWGVEADAQAADLSESSVVSLPGSGFVPAVSTFFVPSTSTAKAEIEWFGTLRARLGYAPANWASGRLLFFVTGGLAFGETNHAAQVFFVPPVTGQAIGVDRTDFGWTAGAGVEYAFTDALSVKAEYLYVNLGDETFTVIDRIQFPNDALFYRFDAEAHVVRAGLNFRFATR